MYQERTQNTVLGSESLIKSLYFFNKEKYITAIENNQQQEATGTIEEKWEQ